MKKIKILNVKHYNLNNRDTTNQVVLQCVDKINEIIQFLNSQEEEKQKEREELSEVVV